ncbi:MAG: molybdopterin molybdenumtransferase MoeA [Lautropia sp.]|nr:MAG: molybdopterin molybdenumtransferase MoeA [Pseudomonadota bacterium]MBC6960977.1 molybdopterin molybdenumtransferase MoeA [Lautropia sp.]MCL4701199.1 molybdopterin molybdotransferase MoeA [Burkholderiaceae bacterium]MDL1907631.1 molybdopterin molybdotransferase MoeA [Betaproteobacteria bacterium PRO1]RIK86340.1 MAG: molybdopterin molybdenumtransferase MoeA [Burkholderiales bacterium]
MKPALLPFDEALAALLAQAVPIGEVETVDTAAAAGRVLAADLRSTLDVPPRDNTQMDGYAVRRADLLQAAPGHPVKLPVAQRIPAGHVGRPLNPGEAARIFTGGLVPDGADAIVMQEMAVVEGDTVSFSQCPAPGEWIRRTGEDIRSGSVILAAGTRLTAQATGLAASVGLASLPVHRPVRVGCFFTGDELAMPGEPLRPGAIYNSNRYVLGALIRAMGCELADLGIVPDTLAATREALRRAAQGNDLIVTSGGVSVGEEDHVKPAVEAEGELRMWQIAIKPGKPLAYGRVRRGTPGEGIAHFIGLPGNPVSSFVTFLLLVRPFVQRLQGMAEVAPRALPMRADFDWSKPDRRREFLRAKINAGGGLDLFPNQSSAVLTSTVWGDGLIDNPPQHPIARGDIVRFLPFSELTK